VDRAQVGVSLRRRDVPMAHHLFANSLRFTELGQQGGRRVPQRVERGAVDGAPEGEPGTFYGAPQATANGLDRPAPVFDDVGVRALSGIFENQPELIADGDDLRPLQGRGRLVAMDDDVAELGSTCSFQVSASTFASRSFGARAAIATAKRT
jgi:hypothetical protein